MTTAFDQGMQLGFNVAQKAATVATVTALLPVLGKDRGDGPIDLGTAGVWHLGDEGWYSDAMHEDEHDACLHLDGAVPFVTCRYRGETWGYHVGHEGSWRTCDEGWCR